MLLMVINKATNINVDSMEMLFEELFERNNEILYGEKKTQKYKFICYVVLLKKKKYVINFFVKLSSFKSHHNFVI